MINIGQLVTAVQHNCHISDARHAGDFSLCIFLLKMREFYRWENEIPLTCELPTQDVGRWLQEREKMWDGLEEKSFEPLPLSHNARDPFDADTINRELVPHGYVYSSGYGRLHKPHFFLGQLLHQENREGFTVYVASCEYARDLEAPPAMYQGNTIFVRQESVRRFLWEKIEESRWNKNNTALARALACYEFDATRLPRGNTKAPSADLGTTLEAVLDRMTQQETETMILHELGEGRVGKILGAAWEKMLLDLPPRAEVLVRALRDLIADGLSTLPTLLAQNRTGSIHFFFANFSGLRKQLAGEWSTAYEAWVRTQNRETFETVLRASTQRSQDTAQRLLALFQQNGKIAASEIEKLLESATPCPFPQHLIENIP